MNVTLYLMTQKGFAVLEALVTNNFQEIISKVIIGRDKNIENDYAEKIIALCKSNHIKYHEKNEHYKVISNFSIAVSWRWLISDNTSRLIVLHDSLLPKYRGFSPLVNMLINEEKEIGVSALFASEKYDQGDIIAQSSTMIEYPIKISKAIELILDNYIELILNIFKSITKNEKIIAHQQNEKLASYSLWRDQHDYMINWNQSASFILNFINAVSSPYDGASTYINGIQKIRVLEAELEKDVSIENRDVGKVIFIEEKYPVIVCKTGLIKLLKVIDDTTKEDILPFKNFRTRLTNFNKQA